jgi:allantoinase
MLDLLVQGDVVLPDSVLRNGAVGIAVGRVAGIYASPAVAPAARETVDAAGCLIYPGMVDAHVHCHSNPAESFESATQAAAAGGVTTIVEMPYDEGAPVNSPAVFRAKVEAIPTTCRVDVALLATLRKRATAAEVAPLVREGACGFKLSVYETHPERFPRIDDDVLWQLLPEIARCDVPVGFHAENDLIIEDLIARARKEGRTSPLAHPETRPPASETLAVLKLLELAYWTKVKLHIFHASQPRTLELVSWFKTQGVDVTAETCPHYLLLDAETDLPRVKAFAKINPSILQRPEREALWAHLLAGRIDFIASDHAPWPLERKLQENIFENPSGAPGLETSLPLMHDALVAQRGQDPSLVARLLCDRPARRFGLAPRKGSIALGADADFAILDPRLPFTVDAQRSYSSAKWSPYDGWTTQGRVVRTILRGRTIFDGEKVVATAGTGQFVPGPWQAPRRD